MLYYSDVERNDAEKVNNAMLAINQNDFSAARSLLQEVVLNTPGDYIYNFNDNNQLVIKFWSKDEYVHYVMGLPEQQRENIVWVISSYPRAYFYLAYIDVHDGNYKSAVDHLEASLKLEPDQPVCYCEMALAYSRMGQHERAVSLYDKALQVRPHMTTAIRARALRGIGVELIELRQLDFAEKYLQESLKYDPNSELAYRELQYINKLRAEGEAGETRPMQLNENKRPDICDYCGRELTAESDNNIEVVKVEGRVLYLCDSCKNKPNIEVEVLLKVLKTQFDIFYQHGQYADALENAERILQIVGQTFGPHNPAMALALNDLALVYKKLGRYVEAEPLCHQSLVIYEKALGPDHPSVAISLNNLADLYRLLDKDEKVEPLLKRALEIKIKALGPDHPGVGNSLNGLAVFYQSQGRYSEAESLYDKVMKIFLNSYGPAHPNFAKSASNLANLYVLQGKYEEAESLLKMSLEIRERTLGPDHPDLASSLNNLAVLYQYQNRFAEAEEVYIRTLNLLLKTIGEENPEFASTITNLAELFSVQGRNEDAEMLYKKALVIYENALGPEHQNVIAVMNKLVDFYKNLGRYADAESLQNRLNSVGKKA